VRETEAIIGEEPGVSPVGGFEIKLSGSTQLKSNNL